MQFWKRVTAIFLSVFTFVAVASSPAMGAAVEVDYAKTDSSYHNKCNAYAKTAYAEGCFEHYGDEFRIADLKNDGRRVAIHWKLGNDARRGLCINRSGSSMPLLCDKNLPEGVRVLIRVGTCDGDVSACDRPRHYGQWSAWDSAIV